MKLLRDTWLIFQRQMQLVLRNPVWVIIGVVQPLYFLFLFGPLLKPALGVADQRRRVPDLHPRSAGDAGHVRLDVRRVRTHRRAAGRRDRAEPGHAGEPARPDARPVACATW